MPDDEQKPSDDKFRPDAIAARIDKIGEETEADRTAREEEQKLAQRRTKQKQSPLEAAASKRLSKIGEAAVKRPTAGEPELSGDPLMVRVANAGKWITKHREAFAGTVGLALLAGAGVVGVLYWQDRRTGEASVLLGEAFAADRGHLSTKDEDDDEGSAVRQIYPTFRTTAERRDAALAKYRQLESKFSGTGAAILARLAEGSLLLDAGDAKGALAAYEDVKATPLAKADAEVLGRALEGIGFAEELLAQKDEAGKAGHMQKALDEYRALEAVDVDGFKELGMFHQSRVLADQGDKQKAISLLKDVAKRVGEPGESHPFAYLQFIVEDHLRELDPTALPPKAPKMPPGVGGDAANNPKLQELIRQLQQQKASGGGGPPMGGGGPPMGGGSLPPPGGGGMPHPGGGPVPPPPEH